MRDGKRRCIVRRKAHLLSQRPLAIESTSMSGVAYETCSSAKDACGEVL